MTSRQNRSTLIGIAVLAIVVIGVVLVMYFAYGRATARTVTIKGTAARKATTNRTNTGTPAWPGFTFSDGVFWQLTGVREYPDGEIWWGGNGVPIAEPKAPPAFGSRNQFPGLRLLEVRYRSTGSDDAFLRRFQFTVPEHRITGHHWQPQSHIAFTGSFIVVVPDTLEAIDLQVGLAAGPPHDLVRADVSFPAGTTQPVLRPATQPTSAPGIVTFGDILYREGSLQVQLFDRRTPQQREEISGNLCVLRRNGQPMHWTGFAQHDGKSFYTFALPRPQIAAAVFQTRAFEWKTLPAVPLQPQSPTTAATQPR